MAVSLVTVSDMGLGVAVAVGTGVGESVGVTGVAVKPCVGGRVGVIAGVGVDSGALVVGCPLQAANQNNTNGHPNRR